jgi:hypothetical protein
MKTNQAYQMLDYAIVRNYPNKMCVSFHLGKDKYNNSRFHRTLFKTIAEQGEAWKPAIIKSRDMVLEGID